MYKLCFFVPLDAAETVKQAVFDAGAGRIGNYQQCCWQTAGEGQFKPLPGSLPAIGSVGQLERVAELKIEMVCADECIQAALKALRMAHPYEEPAFDVIALAEV